MNERQLKDAEKLYQSWSVPELVRATTVERQDYEPEAVDLMLREISRRGVSESEKEDAAKEVVQRLESEKKRLIGIGGFLLVFIIGAICGSLLSMFLGVVLIYEATGVFAFCGALSLALGGYGCYVSYLLIAKRPTAPMHAERLLISGLLLSFFETLIVSLANHRLVGQPLSGVAGAMVWLVYLNNSRRVANTYGPRKKPADPAPEKQASSDASTGAGA